MHLDANSPTNPPTQTTIEHLLANLLRPAQVRLGTYSAKLAHQPPAAIVACRAMAADPRAEPRFGERVPYVVVHGEPGARLYDMVVPPRALVEGGGRLRLHGLYYITRQILPALDRVLSLVGADIKVGLHGCCVWGWLGVL